MKPRIERMQEGEQEALGELLCTHGLALERLLVALSPKDTSSDLADELAFQLWKASAVADPMDAERSWTLAVAAAHLLTHGLSSNTSSAARLDAALYARLAARQKVGLGDSEADESLAELRGVRPSLDLAIDQMREALAASLATPEGSSPRFSGALDRVRARLL